MKIFFYFAFLSICASSCTNRTYCNHSKNYSAKVDTTKPYKISGKYCINQSKVNSNLEDSVLVRFNIYDIITGQPIKEGVIRFDNNSSKILVSDGSASKKLTHGVHNLGISSLQNLTLLINKINLKPNTEVEINCHLGNSLQW